MYYIHDFYQNTNISYQTNLTEDMYPIESDFEMVGQEVFQEHSNYFTPTLDKIKSVKEPSIDPLAGPIYSFYSEKFWDLPLEDHQMLAATSSHPHREHSSKSP